MASSSKSTIDVEKLCADGLHAFVREVAQSKQNGNLPIILAVSRRMPHVLFWFKNTHATLEEKRTLEETEIITEIALPFIDFKKLSNFKVFIIDDVVSSGRTLTHIINLTEVITGKEVEKVFVLFCNCYSRFLLISVEHAEVNYRFSSEEEKSQIGDFISTVIALTLPIDVTYPILYFREVLEESEFKKFQLLFRDPTSRDAENYPIRVKYRMDLRIGDLQVEKDSICESFTALMPSVISNSLNNDFAKIRTYCRLHKYLVVPYAPNILTDGSILSKNLFEAKEYRKIWNVCLDNVDKDTMESYDSFDDEAYEKELKSNRSYRSLVSIANYLYSLSSFNKLATELNENLMSELGEKACKFSIGIEDLSLIVGKSVAEDILPDLMKIIDDRIVSPRKHQKVSIQSTFIPTVYEQDYTVSKYMSIPMGDSAIQTKLKAIFRNASDKRSSYPAFKLEDMEYGVEGIMESFESLGQALHVKSHIEKIEINRWVDERIDNGEIVSRYARVTEENGLSYWRRFFRLSSSLAD